MRCFDGQGQLGLLILVHTLDHLCCGSGDIFLYLIVERLDLIV